MSAMGFETLLDDGVIHVPEAIIAQVARGAAVRVSITPVYSPQADMTPDDAWNSILAFVHDRLAKGPLSAPYTWHREDAYSHLNQPNASNRAD